MVDMLGTNQLAGAMTPLQQQQLQAAQNAQNALVQSPQMAQQPGQQQGQAAGGMPPMYSPWAAAAQLAAALAQKMPAGQQAQAPAAGVTAGP